MGNSPLIYYDSRDEWELYDLQRDPTEVKDLSKNPAWSDRFAALKSQLATLQKVVGDDPADIGAHPRTGNAALDKLERERATQAKK